MSNIATTRAPQELYVEAPSAIIQISEPKLELWMIHNWRRIGVKDSWINALLVLLPYLFSRAAATYKDTFGIGAPIWKTVNSILLLLIFGWFLFSIIRSCRAKRPTDVIRGLKNEMIKFVADADPAKIN